MTHKVPTYLICFFMLRSRLTTRRQMKQSPDTGLNDNRSTAPHRFACLFEFLR
jgi:hypothetical protein